MRFKLKIVTLILMAGALSHFSPAAAIAQNISVEATVNTNKVALGSALNFSIAINGTQNVSDLNLPDIDGFDKKYLGPSRSISIVNNTYSSSISFNYSLLPLRTGQLVIPSYQLVIEGQTFKTAEISVEVVDSQTGVSSENVTELNDKIFIQVQVSKNELYINEPLAIKVFMYSAGLSIRDIQYPRIESIGFIDEPFGQPKQYQQVLEGKRYDIIEFSKVVYPTRTGQLTIGPAQLDCNIVVRSQGQSSSLFEDDFFNAFFDRGEKRPATLTSQPVTVNVIDLPAEGKPADFTGGVGNFNYEVSVSPTEIRVGDPVTLRMKIEGKGNLKAIEFPKIKDEVRFKLYDPIIKEEGRTKMLEQVLIPLSEEVTEIPATNFTYFNNDQGKYMTVTQGPFPIKVLKAEQEGGLFVVGADSQPVFTAPEKIGEDIVFIKDIPGTMRIKGERIYNSFIYSIVLIIMLMVLAGGNLYYKMSHKIQTDRDFARQRKAQKMAKKELRKLKQYIYENRQIEFYDRVFKLYSQYLSNKLLIPVGTIGRAQISKLLEKYQIDKAIMNDIETIFIECESIRYASAKVNEGQMTVSYQRLERIIDCLERKIR